jgi:hypothetical protein
VRIELSVENPKMALIQLDEMVTDE